jgi:hypothetical protein
MMIENFAIEGDGDIAIRAQQRLIATGHVQNAQTCGAQ